ncbi:hypothetical protein HS1genome_0968 [Sulfodiicoccus acidiphilus]|uniref:Phosphatidylethanolamine-binding protein n=1 Tax=Sulfodiicoccus acidiphilus TaxID=1670455 RepID=A0A348B327_9CREN|nr:YbhB/YbcL family Raf kinase inhibitor-like protein [Sulfodiicoccus acidiphilus]BBD72579.1 hypothetical protein HS1genome_0968 [Sulfodiicoccus acidiphilus]GGT93545.1 hypothetical protein GCM10007116_09070 [Sulfodiicoccus acidiphilus]
MKVISNSFHDKSDIPVRYTCDGEDISPHLQWEKVGKGLYAVIMEDPDAPGGTFYHWAIYNVTTTELPEAIPKMTSTQYGDQAINDFGRVGYGGPCPPRGPPHRYFVKVYALKERMMLPARIGVREVATVAESIAVDVGEIMGKYRRGGK